MSNTTAKVHISLIEGILQIEGSESFVSEQLLRLEPHIVRAFEHRDSKPKGTPKKVQEQENTGHLGFGDFDHVFAELNGKVQLLKPLPGSNNAQKTVNAALLLAYAHTLLGNDIVSSDAIREMCKSHACLDASNFAGTLTSEKSLFLFEGTGKSRSLKLTVPGIKKAEDFAKQLNSQ